jgi:hypothetical protein
MEGALGRARYAFSRMRISIDLGFFEWAGVNPRKISTVQFERATGASEAKRAATMREDNAFID